jgi:preprotein translocase subunit YajC
VDVILAQENADGGGLLFPLLMIAGLFAIFYFMLIRPNRRRRQELEQLQAQLSVGDEVMTSSGLYGTIAEVDDKTVILETSEGVFSRYARGAVIERITPAGEAEAESDDSADSSIEKRDGKD